LFEAYRDPLWRFFCRRVRPVERAEELTQDVFAAVLAAAPRYQPRGAFRSYLFGIAFNVLMADRRKRAVVADPLSDHAAPGADPDAVLWVRGALQRLDPVDREILMLREYEQLSYQEIADLQALPLNTVRSRLFRARLALRDALTGGV
jgi:RNA polymerase sigma-70 factor (ECF subfamily)